LKAWQKAAIIGGAGAAAAAFALTRLHLHDYERYFPVEQGDVVLDVGAADGVFTSLAARKASLVIAVEPEPRFGAVLRGRFSGSPNVVVVEKAASDRRGVLPFYPKGYSSSLINGREGTRVEVRADTLDNIISELGVRRVDFVKMDIEGGEVEALEGAENVLRTARKVAVAAYHRVRPDISPTYPWVEGFLRERGFNTITESAGFFDGMGLVYAWRE